MAAPSLTIPQMETILAGIKAWNAEVAHVSKQIKTFYIDTDQTLRDLGLTAVRMHVYGSGSELFGEAIAGDGQVTVLMARHGTVKHVAYCR